MKILILGGYGTFGGRLAQLLAGESGLTLILAGRSESKAKAFCEGLPKGARKSAVRFDRNQDVEPQLREIQPNLVVDASGPFQSYGDQPYGVVQACVNLDIHYMDFADGTDFVAGIAQFDEAAKAKNIYVLSGVSSFPVLSAAVVRHLSSGLGKISSITGGIAPSPYAGVGLNVIRAIASYSGRRVSLVRNGRRVYGYGLTESMHYTICPPGSLPLNNTRFSLVDVPDLKVLPALWPDLDSIWMGAGPVPEILHRMLNALAWLVRIRLLPSLRPFAPVFHFVTNVVRWGEHRGGMFISVEACDNGGGKLERSWHLLAEGEDGPFIPAMAVEAIVRRSRVGAAPPPGARPASGELELDDYRRVFGKRRIVMGCRDSVPPNSQAPLYQRLLGNAWTLLPVPIREMHQFTGAQHATGRAVIKRGTNPLSRLIGLLFRFPAAGHDIPVRVDFRTRNGGEVWHRTFGGSSFSSSHTAGSGRSDRLVLERFGPFAISLALVVHNERLSFVVRRWSFLGLPLPKAWAPGGDSYEFAADGRFGFNVEIRQAICGLIVGYRGWLEVQKPDQESRSVAAGPASGHPRV